MFNSSKLKTFPISYSDAWCSAYISAMAIESGCTDIIPISANCDEMYKKVLEWELQFLKINGFLKWETLYFMIGI